MILMILVILMILMILMILAILMILIFLMILMILMMLVMINWHDRPPTLLWKHLSVSSTSILTFKIQPGIDTRILM